MSKTDPSKTKIGSKISFRVPEKLWETFSQKTDALFISKAPYLDYVLKGELRWLQKDLQGLKQSTTAYRYISTLHNDASKSVNIEVQPKTADELRKVLAEHNVVRDAFVCRVLLFLVAPPKLFTFLGIPDYVMDYRGDGLDNEFRTAPLEAMEAVRDWPMHYIREHLSKHDERLYRVHFPASLRWAACYLEDEVVPRTRAYKKREKLFDDPPPVTAVSRRPR